MYLVKHCNLRCRGCIRFSNIVKHQLYDFEPYKKDIRVFKDFGYVPEHVTLSGGELLVVDNILEYIAAVKEIYPECLISIFTNATLLKKLCNDDLLKFSSQPCALCTYCGNVNPANCQTVPYSTDEAELTDYLA